MKATQVRFRTPLGAAPLMISASDVAEIRNLYEDVTGARRLGIGFSPRTLAAMDAALSPLITTASAGVPIQFLQTFLPGLVEVLTQARKIDELVPPSTAGAWEDEEIIQGIKEPVGIAVPYADYSNVPFSSWNLNFERRSIVRFESGLRVGRLEEERSGRMNVSSAAEKRNSSALALDIQRNRVGFFGYVSGDGRTFGLLNDPALPAYVTVAGGTWPTKTFLQITADIRTALGTLRQRSGDNIDVGKVAITLAIPTGSFDFLTVTSDFGNSVADWLRTTYPNVRVVTVPEFTGANGGANVMYVYADRIQDGGTDGGETFMQAVPARFMALGVDQAVKYYEEGFTNATAGVILKRPFAVVRYSGI